MLLLEKMILVKLNNAVFFIPITIVGNTRNQRLLQYASAVNILLQAQEE
jgi:hypothetical protein